MECVFCQIVSGQLPAAIEYENDHVVVFRDIRPQAPFHWLVVPKKHMVSILECHRKDDAVWLAVLEAVHDLSRVHQLAEKGFRLVTNTGEAAGQTVLHMHFHLLAGRTLHWPPG